MDINELPLNAQLAIKVTVNNSEGMFIGTKDKPVRAGVTYIQLKLPTNKAVNFKNTHIEVTYYEKDKQPIKWTNCQIQRVQNQYVLFVLTSSTKINRRECARVDVEVTGSMEAECGTTDVTIKDISLSGFAVTAAQPLEIVKGDIVYLTFEDRGYEFLIKGELVRVVMQETEVLYGFIIRNIPNKLQDYITKKQRERIYNS